MPAQFTAVILVLLLSGLSALGQNRQRDPAVVRDSIQLICDKIAADSVVETEYVGSGGMLSKQYRRYDTLLNLASDTGLFDLTDHASPAVRLYAYYGLTRRNPDLLVEAMRNHPDDTAHVPMLNGCIGGTGLVIEEAIYWAHEYWVRGNPSGMNRTDKSYLHNEYLAVMRRQSERMKEEKERRKRKE